MHPGGLHPYNKVLNGHTECKTGSSPAHPDIGAENLPTLVIVLS